MNIRLLMFQDYYFRFSKNYSVIDCDIFAKNLIIKILIMNCFFQKETDQDPVDMLKDENKYFEHYDFVKRSLLMKHWEKKKLVSKYYLMKIKTNSDKVMLIIMIYKQEKSFLVPVKKNVSFVGNKKETYIFKAELIRN